MTSMSARVQQNPDVLVRELEGESVLLNLKSESYFGLDEIGTRMWSALVGSPSVEAAFDALLEEYDVEPEQLRSDLDQFVATLKEAGLLDVSEV